MASPLAQHLFAGAIGQSGGRFSRTPHLHEDRGSQPSAERVGFEFARRVGADSVATLRAVPTETLLRHEMRAQENVDGWVLPDEIRTIFSEKRHHRVPVIVGSTADEMTTFPDAGSGPKTLVELRAHLARRFGEHAGEFEQAYCVKSDADVTRALLESGRDTTFSSHMRTWARMVSAAGDRAYLYYFTYHPPHPRAGELGAFHTCEIPYVFNVVPSNDPREAGFAYTEADEQLAHAMSEYWVRFIKTGDPNGNGLPEWPPYSVTSEPYLEFGATIRVGHRLLERELDFLERALARRR